jgi:HK97 family phage prohead protease|nr:MAG TPA: prohead serine protease [Caudoviricetes sp.]
MTCERTALVRDGKFTTRAEDGNLYIEGYFAVFGSEYRMWENAIETIDEDAFNETVDGDVRALVNHDSTLVLGRTTAGTLTLRVDRTGLWGSILINQSDQDAMNLYERVKRGDVSQCSFGFDILDQSTEVMENGTTVWRLKKVELYEVSVVTFPAYEDTSVIARKKDYEELQKRKKELWQKEMIQRLKGVNNGT